MKLSLSHQIVLLKIYVDDLNQAGLCLPLGTRYARGKLYIPGQGWRGRASPGQALSYQEKKAIEDEGNAEKEAGGDQYLREINSAKIFRQIANDILPKTIRMKEDIPGNHSTKCIPILDTQMEVVDGQIVHHYYSKPMSSL